MKKLILIIMFIISINLAQATNTSSVNYQTTIVINEGGANSSTSNYTTIISVGEAVIGITNSNDYETSLGFFFATKKKIVVIPAKVAPAGPSFSEERKKTLEELCEDQGGYLDDDGICKLNENRTLFQGDRIQIGRGDYAFAIRNLGADLWPMNPIGGWILFGTIVILLHNIFMELPTFIKEHFNKKKEE